MMAIMITIIMIIISCTICTKITIYIILDINVLPVICFINVIYKKSSKIRYSLWTITVILKIITLSLPTINMVKPPLSAIMATEQDLKTISTQKLIFHALSAT